MTFTLFYNKISGKTEDPMFICCTNNFHDFDKAMQTRIQKSINFGLGNADDCAAMFRSRDRKMGFEDSVILGKKAYDYKFSYREINNVCRNAKSRHSTETYRKVRELTPHLTEDEQASLTYEKISDIFDKQDELKGKDFLTIPVEFYENELQDLNTNKLLNDKKKMEKVNNRYADIFKKFAPPELMTGMNDKKDNNLLKDFSKEDIAKELGKQIDMLHSEPKADEPNESFTEA